jgi:hypothetical protein
VVWKPVKAAIGGATKVYQTQKSVLAVLRYFGRVVARRGPAALQRRIETRRSLSRIATASADLSDQIKIAIIVGGVVGDNIMAARFLRDLGAECPDVAFDVYTSNVALGKWIYGGVACLSNCFQDNAFQAVYQQYDVSFVFSDTMRLLHQNAKPGRWSEKFSAIVESVKSFSDEQKQVDGLPYNQYGIVAQDLFYKHGVNRAVANHFIAGIPYGGDRYGLAVEDDVTSQFSLAGKRYATVHNGFDLKTVTQNGSATKVYPRFGEVIREIRKVMPDLLFIQIGAATSVVIEEADINLLGRTTLQQAAAIVKQSACHIDNESGIVSIASCFGTPCCVVFGPSSADYFSYDGNVAVRPRQCGGCWWIEKDWMSRCPRGMNEPVCMYTQPPSVVADAVIGLLRR